MSDEFQQFQKSKIKFDEWASKPNLEIQKTMIIVGGECSGKSSVANLMNRTPLSSYESKEKIVVGIQTGSTSPFKIGNFQVPTTKTPNYIQINQDEAIIDMPGFPNDNPHQELMNAYFIDKIFDISKEIKFIFTIRAQDFIIQSKLIKVLNQFCRYFKKTESLRTCTSLVVTNAEKDVTKNMIRDVLKELGGQDDMTNMTKSRSMSQSRMTEMNTDDTVVTRNVAKLMTVLMNSINIFYTPRKINEILKNLPLVSQIEQNSFYMKIEKYVNVRIQFPDICQKIVENARTQLQLALKNLLNETDKVVLKYTDLIMNPSIKTILQHNYSFAIFDELQFLKNLNPVIKNEENLHAMRDELHTLAYMSRNADMADKISDLAFNVTFLQKILKDDRDIADFDVLNNFQIQLEESLKTLFDYSSNLIKNLWNSMNIDLDILIAKINTQKRVSMEDLQDFQLLLKIRNYQDMVTLDDFIKRSKNLIEILIEGTYCMSNKLNLFTLMFDIFIKYFCLANESQIIDINEWFEKNIYQKMNNAIIGGIQKMFLKQNQSVEYYELASEILLQIETVLMQQYNLGVAYHQKAWASGKIITKFTGEMDFIKSIDYFTKSLELDPDFHPSQLARKKSKNDQARVFYDKGNYADAAKLYVEIDFADMAFDSFKQESQRIKNNNLQDTEEYVNILVQKGDYLCQIGAFDSAIKIYKKAQSRLPYEDDIYILQKIEDALAPSVREIAFKKYEIQIKKALIPKVTLPEYLEPVFTELKQYSDEDIFQIATRLINLSKKDQKMVEKIITQIIDLENISQLDDYDKYRIGIIKINMEKINGDDFSKQFYRATSTMYNLEDINIHLNQCGLTIENLQKISDVFINLQKIQDLELVLIDQIGDQGIYLIMNSIKNARQIKNLRLDLPNNEILTAGAISIGQSIKNYHLLENLQLSLGNNNLQDEGVISIADAILQKKSITNLVLYLRNNKLTFNCIEIISRSLRSLENIQILKLGLSNNHIGADGCQFISECFKQMNKLQTLELMLNENGIGDNGIKLIALSLGQLISLNNFRIGLWKNDIQADGVSMFFQNMKNMYNLEIFEIGLGDNLIKTAGVQSLTIAMKSLMKLDTLQILLNENQILNQGLILLSDQLVNHTNLIHLQLGLWNNEINHESITVFSQALSQLINLQSLQLELQDNVISEIGAKNLASSLINLKYIKKLKLGLWENKIGISGTQALSEALKSLTDLEILQLDLWKNGIGKEGAQALSEALSNLVKLQDLDIGLGNNSILLDGAKYLSLAIPKLKQIIRISLDLRFNRIGLDGKSIIDKSLIKLRRKEYSEIVY